MTTYKFKPQRWDLVLDCDGFLGHEFNDWPQQNRDIVLAAMEQQCVPRPGHGISYRVAHDANPDKQGMFYIHIEVVETPPKIHVPKGFLS